MESEPFKIRAEKSPALVEERDRVLGLLREALPEAEIAEVGSTAVEGAIGKEDVDIAVLVSAARFRETRDVLDGLFPRLPEQLSSEDFQGYAASSERDVAVQLTVKGGPHDTFHAFLAALRGDPKLLEAYNQLKRDWDGRPMAEYREAKSHFIANALRRHGRRNAKS